MKNMTRAHVGYFLNKHRLNFLTWNLVREVLMSNKDLKSKDFVKEAVQIVDDFFVKTLKESWENYAEGFYVQKITDPLFRKVTELIKAKRLEQSNYKSMSNEWKKKTSLWRQAIRIYNYLRMNQLNNMFDIDLKKHNINSSYDLYAVHHKLYTDLVDLKIYPNTPSVIFSVHYKKYVDKSPWTGILMKIVYYMSFAKIAMNVIQGILSYGEGSASGNDSSAPARKANIFQSQTTVMGFSMTEWLVTGVLLLLGMGVVQLFLSRHINLLNIATKKAIHEQFQGDRHVIPTASDAQNVDTQEDSNEILLEEGFSISDLYENMINEIINVVPVQRAPSVNKKPVTASAAPAISYTPTRSFDEQPVKKTEDGEGFLKQISPGLFSSNAYDAAPAPMPTAPQQQETFYVYTSTNEKRQVFPFKGGIYYVADFANDEECTEAQRSVMKDKLKDGRVLNREQVGKRYGFKRYSSEPVEGVAGVMKLDDIRVPCSAKKQRVFNQEGVEIKDSALVYLPGAPVLKTSFKGCIPN